MKNPFIPLEKGNTVIVDGRINEEFIEFLEDMKLKVILTTKCEEVAEPISYHPDIVMHPVDHSTLVIAPNVFDYYEDKLYGMGIKLIRGEKYLGEEYPNNIAYNVGRVNGAAIHNFKYTDNILLYYLNKQGLDLINVKQGYSKCSMAIVDERAIITADNGIHKLMIQNNIDSLLIQPGHIVLKGYNYGFIGGTCGNLSKKHIAFSGSFEKHPDVKKIKKFLKKYNKKYLLIDGNPLIDIGTIITLYCN
ncbi:MAG TPA: hypothetical protein VK071_08745 [Tissierellales bacterium]|nr:hypothetical protein [Tissierellales bacterium]